MIIIGLLECGDCRKYAALHPSYTYIELGKGCNISQEMKLKLNNSLNQLKWDKKVPILLNDSMTELIPRPKLIQEFTTRKPITGGCRNCGQ